MTDNQTRLTRCWEMMTEDERRDFWQVGMATENIYMKGSAPCGAVWWRIEEMIDCSGTRTVPLSNNIIWYYEIGKWQCHPDRSTALLMAFEAWLQGRGN